MPVRPSQTDPDALARWQDIRQQIASRIRTRRIEIGLSQEALALESGLSRNQLIELEHGRRGILAERLVDLARVLDVPAGSLLP